MEAEKKKMSKTNIAYYAFTGLAIVLLFFNYYPFD